MTSSSKKPAFFNMDVTIEQAHEIAAELENPRVHHGSSTTTHSGIHPKHGPIHVVIPPLGDATLLPIVVQDFDL